jgi:DNA-binding CsgD family transcriptional regulator
VRRNRLIPDTDFVQTQYYNDFVRPLNGFHSFFYRRAIAECGMALAICRPQQAGDFGHRHEAALAALLPHFGNALDLHCRLRAAERQDGPLLRLLDRLDCGVILTDGTARPLHMNLQAERLLSEADGLSLSHGGLAAAEMDDTHRLRAAIAEAGTPQVFRIHDLSAAAAPRSAGRARLCLERPSLRPPLMVTVLPIWGLGAAAHGTGEPTVALFVDEPGVPTAIDREALAEAFGLTRRESEIAAVIGEGYRLSSAAQRLGLGLGTARNHLKHVFEKTGIHSQATLVALVRSYRQVAH